MLRKSKRMSWVSVPVMGVLALSLSGCYYPSTPSHRQSKAVEAQVLKALQPEQLKVLNRIAYCGDMTSLTVTVKLTNDTIYRYRLINDKMIFVESTTADDSNYRCGSTARGADITLDVWHMPWPVGTALESFVSTSLMLEQPFDDKAKQYIARAIDVIPDTLQRDNKTRSNESSWQAN